MLRRTVVVGLLGGLVMVATAVVVDGILGFNARVKLNRVPNERVVYELLKENITQPGRYVCNPEPTEGVGFPTGEPVFSILNGGMGHEAAGAIALTQLPLFFLLPILAVGLLRHADARVLASYPKKVAFFVAIGLLTGISGNLFDVGIGDYPPSSAVLLCLHDLGLWTLGGLVMARAVKPRSG